MNDPITETIRLWRADPVRFVIDNFGVTPDRWQAKALEAFASEKREMTRISLQACAGPGKSTVLAWMALNFLTCYGDVGRHPKGAAISVTAQTLKDTLWSELSKWHGISPLMQHLFTWTQERVFSKQHPSTWFFSARSFSKTADTEEQGRTLSGLHADYMLYLIDESGDIPPAVLRSAEQGLSNCKFGKIVQAGNPTSLDGMLYAAYTTLRDQWHIISITGDPDDPDRSPRIDIKWAAEQINIWGRDNPWVMSYILGKFPPSSINTLLGPEEVAAAMGRHLSEDKYGYSQKRLGVDVARFGTDSTVIFPRQGLASFKPIQMRNARSNDIAARVMAAKHKWGSEAEFVDGTGGFGSGVIDSMLLSGCTPHEIHFSGKPIDARYTNKRAEMWWEMAQWIKRGGALPNIPQLHKELVCPTYTLHKGKFLIEEKEQIRKRLGFSPDMADALALTFAIPDQPGRSIVGGRSFEKTSHFFSDYDPYSDERM